MAAITSWALTEPPRPSARLLSHQADKKIGAKKLAKLQAKEERAEARRAELEEREERKAREEELYQEELKRRAEEEQKERDEEAAAAKAEEDRKQKEEEEYQAMKSMFSVEAGGSGAAEQLEKQGSIEEFRDYIKSTKVAVSARVASRRARA